MSETVAADGAPHRSRSWKRRRNAVRFGTLFTLLVAVALGALVFWGYDSWRQMTGGATAEVITDPAAPGYVASVDPTPVHLLAITTADDELSAFIVVVPSESGGGTLIWSLGEMIVQIDGEDTTFAQLYEGQGLDAARAEFEKVLGFGAVDATVLGPDELAAIAGPVSPLEISNPDQVSVEEKGKKVEKFESGEIELDAEDLSEFLTIRAAGEAPENRSTRTEVGLTALAEGLVGTESATESSAVTSEGGADVGSVLRALGTGQIDMVVLPTTRQSFRGSYIYRPDTEAIAAGVGGVVRFPISSFPGQRPRVRVLNGTADTGRANSVAPDVASAGGEVVVIGNADSLDVAATSVVYSDPSYEPVATRIAGLLGVTAQLATDSSDAADIHVVLGADYAP